MKDVRMGRVKYPQAGATFSVENAETGLLLGGNANRAAALVWLNTLDLGAVTLPVLVRAGGPTGPAVAALTPYQASAYLTVEVHGSAVTGPLFIDANGGGAAQGGSSEVVWLSDPEDA